MLLFKNICAGHGVTDIECCTTKLKATAMSHPNELQKRFQRLSWALLLRPVHYCHCYWRHQTLHLVTGADQFDEEVKKERPMKRSFFNYWWLAVTGGAFLALTVLVYIEDHVRFGWGYGIPTVGMVASIALFHAGKHRYWYKLPMGSPLTQVAQVWSLLFRSLVSRCLQMQVSCMRPIGQRKEIFFIPTTSVATILLLFLLIVISVFAH